jgi:thiol-disulfide isomerase/thioredoxin
MKLPNIFVLSGICALGLTPLVAQGPTVQALEQGQAAAEAQEQNEINRALAEVASSSVDYIRVAERYLAKYPTSKQRAQMEKNLAKAALEANDRERIIIYGRRILEREMPDDTQLLERVIRALIDRGDQGSGAEAAILSKRYELDIQAQRGQPAPGHLSAPIWSDLLDANFATALALEARATGNAGNAAKAAEVAKSSWDAYPNGEGARAAGYWLNKAGKPEEAIEYYADVFVWEDPRTTVADHAKDRQLLGEVYRKVHQTENGLGDTILSAYDRTSALRNARIASLKARDPNADAVDVPDFILPAVDGSPSLRLATLKGKFVVIDFWATWCIPCREQHPMIEDVKKHYQNDKDIVFLSVDADDDLALVAPFLKEQSWESGYFEAGLARRLTINAIPTLIVLDANGQVASRMTGVGTDHYEAALIERIEAVRHPVTPQ